MPKSLDTVSPLNNVTVALLQRAVESSRSPLIITDNTQPDNPIIYSNSAFTELTGYSMDEIIGKNCRFLQGPDSDQAMVKDIRDAVKNGTDSRTTLKNYRKDGTPFWNDLVVSPVIGEDGKTTHFIGMQLDITDRIEAAKQLEDSNAELEQFTYASSHDMQEPLRMISSYLQLIERRYGDKFDDDGKVFLDFAIEGAERMQALIYDLLALSRITSITEEPKPVSLNTITDRVLQNLSVSIKERGAKVTIDKLPTLPIDPVQMTQLFQNLISNGIKYCAPYNTPEISITATKSRDAYVFSVTDNGIGIPEQYRERVFQIFQRLHTKNEYPGTGVGLAICSKIIDRHGGTIWVESNKDAGSTFKFTLPATRKVA